MSVRFAERGATALLVAAFMLTGLLTPIAPAPIAMAVAPVAAPTGLSPSVGTTVNANPVLSWNAVTGAVRYRVQVSTQPDFSVITYTADTTELRATPPTDLPLTTLYWRVAGMDASNAVGPWGDTQFTKAWGAAPALVYPNDLATLVFPTDALRFTWTALAGAQSYELQVDDAADFIGATTYPTKNTSYVITEPKTSGQTFYWRVRGVSATSGVVSDWSETRDATFNWPAQPELLYPADDQGGTSPIDDSATSTCQDSSLAETNVCDLYFAWTSVLGAKTYQLQVSPNGDWTNTTIDLKVKGTRYALPTTLNNGSYYWRVRALDAASTPNNGPWSDVGLVVDRVFRRAWSSRPTLVAPTNGASVGIPTFSWTPIDHAAYYHLQVSTDVNFGAANQDCYTNRTTWTPYNVITGVGVTPPDGCSISLNPGVTYYWHVRGIDAPVLNAGAEYSKGVLGLWSNASNDPWQFTYAPDMPDYFSPANGSTVQVPTLTWTDSAAATRYHVTILKSNGSVATTADTYSTSYTPTTQLQIADSPFRWYVQAYDVNNKLGAIPALVNQWTFTLTAITGASSPPDQISPADAAGSVMMQSLAWQPVTGAAKYQVMYSVVGSGMEFPLGPQTFYPAYTYTDILSAGTYYWYVNALDSGGALIASSTATRTFVVSQLDLVGTADYLTPTRCATPPACTPVKDTATLSWNPVPGALSYTVYVATDPNFTNNYRTYSTTFTALSPRDSWLDNQANQAYYWFVRPARDGNTGRYDDTALLNASAYQKRSEGIHLLSPAASAVLPNLVTFTWQDFLASNQGLTPAVTQEARQYHVQVSTVADFASILDDKIIDETFYTPFDKTYPEGPLYWRVQAIDASGNYLTWSPIRTLTKSSPFVENNPTTYPSAGATVTGVPYFTWPAQAFAATYDIQIARNGDTNFSLANQVTQINTKMSAFAYTEPLGAGDYAWHVRRQDADGRAGPWSATRVFHLVPVAPTLISPANTTALGLSSLPTLLFTWSSTQPYPKYVLETSTSASFSSITESRTTVMMSWAPLSAYATGTYYWRVKALNAGGTIVATSSVWTFSIATVPGAPTAVAGVAGNGQVTVSWVAPSNGGSTITSYTATASPGGRTCTVTGSPAATSCTVTGLTNGTAYTFTVRATNAIGQGPASTASAAVTPSGVPGAPTGVGAVSRNLSAVVSWVAPASNGGSAITGYTVTASPGGATCTAAATARSCTVSGLTNGTWYTFTVRARNVIGTGPASAASAAVLPQPTIVRYFGADNFATGASITSHTLPANCGCTVYVASTIPDPLTGSAAAAKSHGAVLMVTTTSVPAATASELTRLRPARIVVLGGTASVPDAIYNTLVPYAPPGAITRIGGADRFVVAAGISRDSYPTQAGGCKCTVYIATAYTYPDALAAATAQSRRPGPVLLVNATGSINANTATELHRLAPSKIIVLGGTASVSTAVYNLLIPYAPSGGITRYSGVDRFEVAYKLAVNTFPSPCNCVVYIAAGTDYLDALSAGSVSGVVPGPLLLVNPTGALPAKTVAALTALKPYRIVVVGNTTQVSDAVLNLLRAYVPAT